MSVPNKSFNCLMAIRKNGRPVKCMFWQFRQHLNIKDYQLYKSCNNYWMCQSCSDSIFPFNSIEDEVLLG